MGLYCGIDWATDYHDVAVVDDDGRVVARGRVSNDTAGFAQAVERCWPRPATAAEHRSRWGIETDRGLWVPTLRDRAE